MNIQWADFIKTILTLIPLSVIASWVSKHGKFSATVTKPKTYYNHFKKYDLGGKIFYWFFGGLFWIFGGYFAYCMLWFLSKNQNIGYLISALAFMLFIILGVFMFIKPREYKTFTTFVLNGNKYFIIGNRDIDDFYLYQTAIQLYKTELPKDFEKIKKDKVSKLSSERVSLKSLKKYIDENK